MTMHTDSLSRPGYRYSTPLSTLNQSEVIVQRSSYYSYAYLFCGISVKLSCKVPVYTIFLGNPGQRRNFHRALRSTESQPSSDLKKQSAMATGTPSWLDHTIRCKFAIHTVSAIGVKSSVLRV